MRTHRKITLLVLTFVVGSVQQGGTAQAQTFDVVVGQFLETTAAGSMRFFPRSPRPPPLGASLGIPAADRR